MIMMNTNNKGSNILGIHDGHNSTIAYLKKGELVDVLQEERLRRVKNVGNFPEMAFKNTIINNELKPDELHIGFNGLYMNYGVWDRGSILKDYESSKSFNTSVKVKVKSNKTVFSVYTSRKGKERITSLNSLINCPSLYIQSIEHHTAHAASAYYGWGKKDKVLILTCDGQGDGLCATVSIGENGKLSRIAIVTEDNSIGRLYAFVTYLIGCYHNIVN